jgi:hypothetical protein
MARLVFLRVPAVIDVRDTLDSEAKKLAEGIALQSIWMSSDSAIPRRNIWSKDGTWVHYRGRLKLKAEGGLLLELRLIRTARSEQKGGH